MTSGLFSIGSSGDDIDLPEPILQMVEEMSNCNSTQHRMQFAMYFAEFYHGEQLYGMRPYIVHLEAVTEILSANGFDTVTWIQAGTLHDVVEDTECTIEIVRDLDSINLVGHCIKL